MGKLFKLFIHIAFFVQLLLLLEASNTPRAPPKCNLNLLSMLSYPSTKLTVDCSDGPDLIPAGYLAIEMINNRSDILEDYHLELIDGHAGCGNPALSIWEGLLVKEIFDSGKKVAGIVGLSCYDLAEKVGLITAKKGIALVNAHISSSFILGDAILYPYSVGITPSMLRFVDAFAALMKNSSWKHIGFVFEDSVMHLTVFQSLFFKVGQMNGHKIAFSSIVTENYIPLDSIKRSSARVVLAFIGSSLAQKVMCLAHYKDMLFPKYQWIFLYRKLDEFREVDFKYEAMSYKCSEQQMLLTLNCSLSIDFSSEPVEPNRMLFSGVTYREFTQQYSNAVRRYNSGEYGKPVRMATTSLRGNLFHDAVWVLALALNATDAWMKTQNMSLCDYGYGQPNVTRKICDEMIYIYRDIGFLGASGWNNCTPGMVILSQFSSNGVEKIATYHDDNHLQLLSKNAVLLANPVQKCQVPLPMFITILIVLFIAFILIALINTLNVVFREHSSVKASSHRLNHLGYIGCYLILIGIAVLNITERFFFSLTLKIYLCNSIPWLGSIGFTLTYGTVIVKLYRLYRTFVVTSRNLQRPQSGYVLMKDSSLAVVIVAMTVPVVIICAVWMSIDPIAVNSNQHLNKLENEPSYLVFESCIINDTHFPVIWLGLLMVYKHLLCIIAGFLFFLTRSIHVRNFETGNVFLLSMLLLLTSGVGLPIIVILLSLNISLYTLHLLLFVTFIVVWTIFVYLCIFVLFLPPVYAAVKEKAKMCCNKQ